MNSTLQKGNIIATPTASTTPEQQRAAQGQGFSPVASSFNPQTILAPYSPSPVSTMMNASDVPNSNPLSVPQPKTGSDPASGISGAADSSLESHDLQVANDAKVAADTAAKNQSKSDITDIQNQILGVESGRAGAEAAAGIPEKNQLANDSYTALQASKRAQEKELKALDTANMTDAGRAAASRDINRAYAFEQADLSIALDVANRNLTAAQQTVDRKIELQLEPLKTQLDFQKSFYDENKDQLTKDEDRQYQAMLTVSQRAYDTAKTNAASTTTWVSEAIKQGRPDLVSSLSKIDPNSKTFTQDIASITSKLATPGLQSITNPDASKYSTALSVILGSSKFTKDQKVSVINAINNGEDPFSVIKNQAKNIMGQTEATRITNYEVARDTLADIGTQLADFYAAGGKTSLISGTMEQVVNKLGEVKDPNLVNLATQIQGNLQIYRNAISGTAYSTQEGQAIERIFPGINKSESLNTAILSGRKTLFDSVIDASYRTALGKTYDDLKKESDRPTQDNSSPVINTGTRSVTAGGQTYTFPTIDQLNSFLKEAHLQ